jgi:hypothetical protein
MALTDKDTREGINKEGKNGRTIGEIEDLKKHDDAKAAKLQEAEILALQLYTGLV